MRIIQAVAALILLAGPAHALTMTCTETARIGMNWNADHWEPGSYPLQTHTVRSVDRGEEIGEECFDRMSDLGMSTDRTPTFSGATSSGCFSLTGTEEEKYFVSPCRQTEVDGVLMEVRCSDAMFDNIHFLVGGEFELSNTFAGVIQDDYISETRDPVTMALGRCEVIEP